jgi:hypothetical protein
MPLPTPKEKENEDLAKEVDLLAREVEKLRLGYEQYFLGLQKDEPLKIRAGVTKLLGKLSGTAVQNARIKYRLSQTIARYNTFSTYWNRILKEIEDGRYQRDVFRATLHEKERSGPPPVPPKADPYKALYAEFLAARKQCNEPVTGLTLEGFRKTMTAQLTALKQKTPAAASFRFQVAVEGGKTKIKAIPQK